MANKVYNRLELKTLLEGTQQEVRSKLLSPLEHNDQFFYQNFGTICLKALKYANQFLNLINSDQQIGKTIDKVFKDLNESLNDYKGRNIFVQSTFSQDSDLHHNEEDEIYHFLNTRNNNIPAHCLNNYESERQRNELEQFLQEMTKHSKNNPKQPKRSLILPKENTFKLKVSRKATFDTELRCIEEQVVQNKTHAPIPQSSSEKTCTHAQIQTDFSIKIEEENLIKNADVDLEVSQCESIAVFENTIEDLSSRKLNLEPLKKKGNVKKKGEKSGGKGEKGKGKGKKWKGSNNPSCISFKASMQVLAELQEKQEEKDGLKAGQCSIKSVNPFLSITKQLNLFLTSGRVVDHFQFPYQYPTPLINEQSPIKQGNPSYYTLNKQVKAQQSTLPIGYAQQLNQQICEIPSKKQDEIITTQWQVVQDSPNQLQSNSYAKITTKNTIKGNQYTMLINEEREQSRYDFPQQSVRLPTSSVKIKQEHQLQQNGIKDYTKLTSQYQAREGYIKNSKKKKIYTNSNHPSHPIASDWPKQNKNILQGINKSNLQSASATPIIDHSKKQNRRQSNVSSVIGRLDVSVVSSAASQDYLISRQKAAGSIKNKLCQIVRNEVKEGREGREGKNRLMAIRSSLVNSLNVTRQSSLNGHQPQQPDKRGMMIFFSKPNSLKKSPHEPHPKVDDQSSPKQHPQTSMHKHMLKTAKIERSSIAQTCQTPQPRPDQGQNLSLLKKYRNNQCKTMEAAMGQRPHLYHKSTEITPVKACISSIRQGHLNTQEHKKVVHSSSEHHSQGFEFHELKRKLRYRANKDKLSQYLELIQATHLKFCGKDCCHLNEVLKGEGAGVSEQILRLFKRLK